MQLNSSRTLSMLLVAFSMHLNASQFNLILLNASFLHRASFWCTYVSMQKSQSHIWIGFPYTVALLSGKIAGLVRAYLVHELCISPWSLDWINVVSDFTYFSFPLPSYPTTSKNAYTVSIASQMLIHPSLTHAQAHQYISLVHAVVLLSEAFW